ncbi:hypothetical protein [Mycobacteroides immunogenum]|uniref:NERD domain-containing protein n=2 Tax=Mycobacteroides immunogenum TaxID=83262 RepID=A0A7V8RXL6_9MYCO|nr:hypothetical protein [Mycobacteroides immunogenum]AMT70344.1 hypothetical protein ABG82_08400 [Mycobacteroides immunogenum]ANO03409.1 hypothetical protein BAB75_08455 [Mycobacteroides immunogenum]KIU42122.1 hypothetical protein TL11_03185 [Mycobacteroides immunogenum]KPG13432.1 hypothetical protein AN909_03730 [Mycobacteroides immunogenum]KPG14650.1 hypothetical protein AN908_09135 [Mycobacteroides immunogenum]
MVERSDPLHLYGALHMWDVRARSVLSGAQLHGSDALLEFFAGVITSEPEADVTARLRTQFDPQIVLDAENQLRKIGELQASIDFGDAFNTPPKSPVESVMNLLALERHFDRMAGFERHLRRIADQVFDLVDIAANEVLGFQLSDAVRFADLHSQALQSIWESVSHDIAESHAPLSREADDAERMQWLFTDILMFVLDAAAPLVTPDHNGPIAEALGLGSASFENLISALATPLGSQQIQDLHSDNSVRNHPILQTSSGDWMWCRPVDFVHCIFDWAFETCQRHPRLLQKFDKARQSTAERLPADVLAEVFGEDRLHVNVTYPDKESDAEADIVVCLPGANLIVECKGGRITAAARRGAPKRVEKHAEEMITKAADQNLRTAAAIRAGATLNDSKGRVLPVQTDDLNLAVICTFDRIDPFNTYLGHPQNDSLKDRSWTVTLADLLLIADVLPDPSEFFAYIRRRVEMVRADSHRVIVEADALGAWCQDRFNSSKPVIPGGFTLIDKTSDLINDYFTIPPDYIADEDVPRPQSGVPLEILGALGRLLNRNDPEWVKRTEQGFSIHPSEWRIFNRRLALAVNPAMVTGRTARKHLAQAQRGFIVAGMLPVKINVDAPVEGSEGFLIVEPAPTDSNSDTDGTAPGLVDS